MLEADTGCRHGPEPQAVPLVNGVRLDPLRIPELEPQIHAFLECGRSHVVHFLAAHPTVVARRDATYRMILNRGNLNLADGFPVAWTLRLLGHEADRISGTDSFRLLCDRGRARGTRHFFYGGTSELLRDLQARLEGDYEGIAVAGAIAPPFRPMSDDELRRDAERIRASRADLVWVGLGAPKQDVVGERLRQLGAAPVVLCVGAAFDFVAGTKKRAPLWMQQHGLEWLFRLGAEPRRLWRRYLIGNPQFVAGVLSDVVRTRGGG